jgi:tryptophan synthase alpha subunit
VAPTTPDDRLRRIGHRARGFLYCIALKGVTGARSQLDSSVKPYLARVRAAVGPDLPIALGFGISKPAQIREVAPYCDAVVVGSALIQTIQQAERKAETSSRPPPTTQSLSWRPVPPRQALTIPCERFYNESA